MQCYTLAQVVHAELERINLEEQIRTFLSLCLERYTEQNEIKKSMWPNRTGDKITAHEGHGQLFREAVLGIPDWEALAIKVIPEVRQRHGQGVLVGVFPLELIHDKRTSDKRTKAYWLEHKQTLKN